VGYFCEQLDALDLLPQNKEAIIKPGKKKKFTIKYKQMICTNVERLYIPTTRFSKD
jgi:hypothetical protein